MLAWEEDPNNPYPLNKILTCEIKLSLMRADEIILNGKLIQIKPLKDFFQALHQEVNPELEQDLDSQIQLFNNLSTVGWDEVFNLLKATSPDWYRIWELLSLPEENKKDFINLVKETTLSTAKNLETKVINTFLPICVPLRLAAEGCWHYANYLIINKYHSSLHPIQNKTFSLDITSLNMTINSHKKRLYPATTRMLTFSWTIFPAICRGSLIWKGKLLLKNFTFKDGLTFEQKKNTFRTPFFSKIFRTRSPARKKGRGYKNSQHFVRKKTNIRIQAYEH